MYRECSWVLSRSLKQKGESLKEYNEMGQTRIHSRYLSQKAKAKNYYFALSLNSIKNEKTKIL